MHIWKLAVPTILGIFIGGSLFAVAYEAYQDKSLIDALSFSNTAEWDPLVYEQRTVENPLVGEAVFALTLPPHPANTSRETKEEIAYMHELETSRTLLELKEIYEELSIESAKFGDDSYYELTKDRPLSRELLERAVDEIAAAIVVQKEYFDRVRPDKLDNTLTPAIPVPGHPAYPSGHAGQSMIVALILAELDPMGSETYIESAKRIAQNRVIAGVHYPSDSKAGQELAQAYFDLLKENAEYQRLRDKAKAEW